MTTDQIDQIPFCPILRPSASQFKDFYTYIQNAQQKYKKDYGIVKIIPPAGWNPHDQNYQQMKKQIKVKKPIQQHARMTKNDFYQIRNIIQQTMGLRRFQKRIADKTSLNQQNPKEIQKMFWKTIKYTPPIYGADLHGSLMSDNAGNWNLGDLDSLLIDAAPVLIKGVTYPYVYVGTWKSIFCWHKQDLDLAAINYLHEGKQKIWYCIQTDHQNILQQQARQGFPESYSACPNFMRHKTTLINPYRLKSKHPNLKISKAYQGPNQFMVAFSGSYHCGFNSGKNIAQAVNFATKDWLRKLIGVTYCTCTQRSVRPDYKYFIENLEHHDSQYKNDIDLKTLKEWTIKNGLFNDIKSKDDQEEEPNKKLKKRRGTKKSTNTEKNKKIVKNKSVKQSKQNKVLKRRNKTNQKSKNKK